MQNIKKLVPVVIISLLTLGGLAGCNTVEGVGKDLEAAGDAIEDSASDNKGY